jgi:LysM repeat protein
VEDTEKRKQLNNYSSLQAEIQMTMNRIRIILLFISVVFFNLVSAQELIVEGTSPNLHLTHTIAAKETWYSIGKTFNVLPKELASYNKLKTTDPLEIGGTINIPLSKTNFTQTESRQAGEIPVYHIIQNREWMYRISVNHYKVPIERLEKWNSIKSDDAKAGMKLIVGFLKVKDPSAVAAAQQSQAPATTPAQTATTHNTSTQSTPPATQPQPQQPVAANEPAGGGYFRNQFDANGKNYSGVSGIFKSTSGWNDGKYYALMNNVTVGTIVKVNFPQTNKSIYAKVLGELPEMKESDGLALRISDAAAKELGAVNNKFSVQVMY